MEIKIHNLTGGEESKESCRESVLPKVMTNVLAKFPEYTKSTEKPRTQNSQTNRKVGKRHGHFTEKET